MKKISNLTAMAVMAVAAFSLGSCCDDDSMKDQVINRPSDMPEVFKGIWAGHSQSLGAANQGLMLDFTSGDLMTRLFGYSNGEGMAYKADFSYDKSSRKGDITLSPDGTCRSRMSFTLDTDTSMTAVSENADTLDLRYIGPSTEGWWYNENTTVAYGNGPTTDLGFVPLGMMGGSDGIMPFAWFTPAGILSDVSNTLVKAVTSKAFGAMYDKIFKGPDPVMDKLESISAQLAGLNEKMDDLMKMVKLAEYNTTYNQRSLMYKNLDTQLRTIFNELKDYNGSKEDSINIMTLVNKFGNMSLAGTTGAYAVKAYINQLENSLPFDAKENIGQVYDYIIFNSVAWEAEGYEGRLKLRCDDAYMIDRLALITMLYWKYTDASISEKTRQAEIENIENAVNEYQKKCEEYDKKINFIVDGKLIKNDKYAVCQINGAHIKFPLNIVSGGRVYIRYHAFRSYDIEEAFKKYGKKDDFSKNLALFYNYDILIPEYVHEHCMTEKEVNAILEYYGHKKTLYEIFNEHVAPVPFSNKPGQTLFLMLQGGGRGEKVDWYTDTYRGVYINKAANCLETNPKIEHWRMCRARLYYDNPQWYFENTNPEREWIQAFVERYK